MAKARSARAIAGYKTRTPAKSSQPNAGGGAPGAVPAWARMSGSSYVAYLRESRRSGGGGFNESEHPRKPAGTAAGGEFRKK